MSDTLETNRLRRLFPTPSRLNRLRLTPMRDLVRGRITGRLDWRAQIAAAPLAQPVRDLICRVVRKTGLWRIEKTEVADELIAHFIDGLASGTAAEELIRDFGSERAAARLIRRAKRRNRSYFWHARAWLTRGVLLLLACYLILLGRFWVGRPTVTVDYLARLNEPILSIPEADRAWPIYRRAILALQTQSRADPDENNPLDPRRFFQVIKNEHPYNTICDAHPGDPEWPLLVRLLEAHANSIEMIRQAAAKPSMGFVLGAGGSQEDAELGWKFAKPHQNETWDSLLAVLLPYLTDSRRFSDLLSADTRQAMERHDMTRVERDYTAMLGLARQQRDAAPFLVGGLIGISINNNAFEALGSSLYHSPERFDDASLMRLAHLTASVGGETPTSLLDLRGERMFFYDFVQRIFTDDGNGDGRLTKQSIDALDDWRNVIGANHKDMSDLPALVGASVGSLVNSRQANVAEYNRLMDLTERAWGQPSRTVVKEIDQEISLTFARLRSSTVSQGRYLPVLALMPSFNRAGQSAEHALARRDGVLVGIALELYRRRHAGAYPATLQDLVPQLLPQVPADRVSGDPLRLRIIDAKPVVYSVGVDGDDDDGRPALDRDRQPNAWAASLGSTWRGTIQRDGKPGATQRTTDPAEPGDGDWILFGKPLYDRSIKPLARAAHPLLME